MLKDLEKLGLGIGIKLKIYGDDKDRILMASCNIQTRAYRVWKRDRFCG